MELDVARLAEERGMSARWVKRAEFVANLLPQGLAIADIGCGAMQLERLTRPSAYIPIDRYTWDERTRVIDLETRRLPADWLKGCDLACLLGVLEYIPDPRSILDALAEVGCAVLFTYHPTDLTLAENTRSPAWRSFMTTDEVEAMIAGAGFQIAKKFVYEQTQRVYLCHPADAAPDWIAKPKGYDTIGPRQKPTLVISGFYGRGNCGDEALLQCACEAMRDDFDIVISLDEHGAHQGYWDWFPYDTFPRIHQTNLGLFRSTRDYAGLLIGGGGLPYGFGASQAIHARTYLAATAIAGVDFVASNLDPRMRGAARLAAYAAALKEYTDLFDFRAARTQDAVNAARELGIDYFHGADWALNLPMDRDPSVEKDDRRVLLVLRELPLKSVNHRFVEQVGLLISELENRGLLPHFLPFAPEDERFLDHIGLQNRIPVVRTWWNPRRAKQWIASSGLTISIARLHPLIFAAPTGARVVSLVPRSMLSMRGALLDLELDSSKLANICRELGVQQFYAVDEMLAELDAGTIRPADPEKVALSMARLDAMIERMRQMFRKSAESRAAAPTP